MRIKDLGCLILVSGCIIQPFHAFTYISASGSSNFITSSELPTTRSKETGLMTRSPLLHQRQLGHGSSSALWREEQVTNQGAIIHTVWRRNAGFNSVHSVWDPMRAKHVYFMITPSLSLALVLLWWKLIPSPHLNLKKKKKIKWKEHSCIMPDTTGDKYLGLAILAEWLLQVDSRDGD